MIRVTAHPPRADAGVFVVYRKWAPQAVGAREGSGPAARREAGRCATALHRRQIEADDLRLRHLLERELDALAPEPRVLHTAERHGVEAIVRRVVDHHAAAV